MTFKAANLPEKVDSNAQNYYNNKKAILYTSLSNEKIQSELTSHALLLLSLSTIHSNSPLLLLDIGCGSGLSILRIQQDKHFTIGFDISKSMLDLSRKQLCLSNSDVFQADFRNQLCFHRPLFDAAIGISSIQWLFVKNIDGNAVSNFFISLRKCLLPNARAVFQVYFNKREQAEELKREAEKNGFQYELLMDYPHTSNAKKWFIYLCNRCIDFSTFTPRIKVRCLLASSYDGNCAVARWKKLQLKVSINSIEYQSIVSAIERLYEQHIKSSHHLLRAYRRSQQKTTTGKVEKHNKEIKALSISKSRMELAKKLIKAYDIFPTLEILRQDPEKVVEILHSFQ